MIFKLSLTTTPLSGVAKPLRRLGRRILFFLAQKTLAKHKPDVIAIVGSGATSVAKEAIYTVLKQKYPVRRNLEEPYAEFVVPLTILGEKSYPQNIFEWVILTFRNLGRLFVLPSHKNILILELTTSKKEIFDYWWKLCNPKILVIIGSELNLKGLQKPKITFAVLEKGLSLTPYFGVAKKIGKKYRISEKEAEDALAHFEFPHPRIKILQGKLQNLIVDATHHFFPPPKESLTEILSHLPGEKIFLDEKTRLHQGFGGRAKNKIIVIQGQKKKMWETLLGLTGHPWT